MNGTAVQKIKEIITAGIIQEVDGKTFSPVGMAPVIYDPRPNTLTIYSLRGILDFVEANVDDEDFEKCILHVVSPESVRLITQYKGETAERNTLIEAKYESEVFSFNRWIDQEEFIISVRSLFKATDDREYILHHTAKIDTNSAVVTEDDGVTQQIRVRKGVSGAMTEAADIRPIVSLRPFRTFPEVEQPESEFLFRMKENNGAIYCMLIPADNEAWKSEARTLITEYLAETGIPIIA